LRAAAAQGLRPASPSRPRSPRPRPPRPRVLGAVAPAGRRPRCSRSAERLPEASTRLREACRHAARQEGANRVVTASTRAPSHRLARISGLRGTGSLFPAPCRKMSRGPRAHASNKASRWTRRRLRLLAPAYYALLAPTSAHLRPLAPTRGCKRPRRGKREDAGGTRKEAEGESAETRAAQKRTWLVGGARRRLSSQRP